MKKLTKEFKDKYCRHCKKNKRKKIITLENMKTVTRMVPTGCSDFKHCPHRVPGRNGGEDGE